VKRRRYYECAECGSVANTGEGKARRCARCGGAKFRAQGGPFGSLGFMKPRHFLDGLE
jgi:Zn finger protein HypA/HybF involved in hydrogenase expression